LFFDLSEQVYLEPEKAIFYLKETFFGFFNFLAEKKLFALEPDNAN